MKQKRRNIFAVCDLEMEYAYNFMEYLNQRRNLPFEVQAFTSAEILCEFARNNPVELLLISERAFCEEVKELSVGKLVILSEGGHPPELEAYPSVYKYQASDAVVREVMDCYGAEKLATARGLVLKKNTEVIGIYSPVGRSRKTSFALTLGQLLAKERAVLYLNLESYSGFEQIFGELYDRNISDLLYFQRQEQPNLVCRLNGMVRTLQNLDFVPPALSPLDIQCASACEWLSLFDEIVRYSSYEVLILDIGDGVQELYRILDYCSKIYVPTRGDALSEAKVAQFENILQIWDYETVRSKLEKIRIPFFSSNQTGRSYFEDLVWGELGDYVRQLLRKEDK